MSEFLAKLKRELDFVLRMLDTKEYFKARGALILIQEEIHCEMVNSLHRLKVRNEKVRASRGKKALIRLLKKL